MHQDERLTRGVGVKMNGSALSLPQPARVVTLLRLPRLSIIEPPTSPDHPRCFGNRRQAAPLFFISTAMPLAAAA
jgi:hypothetical protein